jgi:hypothetical protein
MAALTGGHHVPGGHSAVAYLAVTAIFFIAFFSWLFRPTLTVRMPLS